MQRMKLDQESNHNSTSELTANGFSTVIQTQIKLRKYRKLKEE